MGDPAASRIPSGRALASLAFLVVVAPGLFSPAARTHDPTEQPTNEQRQELQHQAVELNNASLQAAQRGDLTTALEKARQLLRIMERLYPKDGYPQGHPDLAASLNNLGYLLHAQGDYGEGAGVLRAGADDVRGHLPQGPPPAGTPRSGPQSQRPGRLLAAQGDYGGAQGTTSGRWR